ncbi:hypothetical protein [Microbacterium sp. NPDC087592]|uniref:hypothetical protein n=1 Tax=Microbacterium sp. NPDC087592 TaxID=3364193 RepID=UPI0037F83CAF
MSKQDVTLHYNGTEFLISIEDKDKIEYQLQQGRQLVWHFYPVNAPNTMVGVHIGPGVPLHFTAARGYRDDYEDLD